MTDEEKASGQGQEAPDHVRVAARLSHPLIIAGEEARVYLRVDVEAPAARAALRPVAVGVALDRSGSMYGSKMAFAKLAVKHLVEMLTTDDVVAVSAYDDVVERVVPAGKVQDPLVIVTRVMSLEARGTTNLSGGYLDALGQLPPQDDALLRRVFLLSDGLANQGVVNRDRLADLARRGSKEGATLSTFGVGLEFDEVLLEDMAKAGGGSYYYIDSPENIPEVFAAELADLATVAAQNLTVDFLPCGARIAGVLGFARQALPAVAGDLVAGVVRSVIIALDVPASTEGRVPLGEVVCSWTALDGDLQPTEQRIAVSAEATDSAARVAAACHQDIIRAAMLQLAADESRAAVDAAASGDREAFRRHLHTSVAALDELTDDPRDERYRETRRLTTQLSQGGMDVSRDSRLLKETRFHQYRYHRERDPGEGGRSR